MRNKLTILISVIFIFVVLTVTVNAQLGTFRAGDCINVVTNLNATAVNISGITSPSPNQSILITNAVMTKSGNLFNYTFCNTSQVGIYTYGYCDNAGNCYSNNFEVTKTGSAFGISDAVIYGIILAMALIFFVISVRQLFLSDSLGLITGFISLSYFLLVVIIFMSDKIVNNFIPTLPAVGAFLDTALIISIVGIFVLFIGLTVYVINHMLDSIKTNKLVSMGHTPEEANRYKRK